MDKKGVIVLVAICVLLSAVWLFVGTAEAVESIGIQKLNIDPENGYGYVDYRASIEANTTGWVLLSIDGENLFWESIELKVTLDESKCFFIPAEGTVKFPINRTEGSHNVEVTFIVDLVHVNTTWKYVIETPIVVEEVEEVKTDNLSGYPQIDSDVIRVVKITEEVGSTGVLLLRIEVESGGKTYTFGARAKDYCDDSIRRQLANHWVEEIEEAAWRPPT